MERKPIAWFISQSNTDFMQDIENLRSKLREKLEWGKLATFVPNKAQPIYNWFYYKEGFAKELVLNLLEQFKLKPGHLVLDPFCGSGTTLLTCKEKGIESIGFDTLPVSVFASRVKTQDYDIENLKNTSEWVFSQKFKYAIPEMPKNYRRFFTKHTVEDIAFFRNLLSLVKDKPAKEFLLLGMINTAMKCSHVWKDGGVLKIRKHPVPPFRKLYRRVIKRMIKDYERFANVTNRTKEVRVFVDLGDARKLNVESESVNGIITSPPYLNQIDYTKVYTIENWFIGQPRPALRSYLGLREGMVSEEAENLYLNDMERVIFEMYRVCRPGAKVAVVVGNAYIPDRVVEVDMILSKMAQDTGFKVNQILVLVNKNQTLINIILWCVR